MSSWLLDKSGIEKAINQGIKDWIMAGAPMYDLKNFQWRAIVKAQAKNLIRELELRSVYYKPAPSECGVWVILCDLEALKKEVEDG